MPLGDQLILAGIVAIFATFGVGLFTVTWIENRPARKTRPAERRAAHPHGAVVAG